MQTKERNKVMKGRCKEAEETVKSFCLCPEQAARERDLKGSGNLKTC